MIERRTCTFDPSRVVSSFKSQGMEVLVSQAASIQVVQKIRMEPEHGPDWKTSFLLWRQWLLGWHGGTLVHQELSCGILIDHPTEIRF